MPEFTDAVALVTGASSGIGAELVRELHRRGTREIVLVARRKDRLIELAEEIGSSARVRCVDLSDPTAVEQLLVDEPRVDLLVNNAGFGYGSLFESQASDRHRQMLEVNCQALVRLTSHYLPAMLARGHGWILNVGSVAGLVPMPSQALYGATKAFVNSFTEALRAEVRGRGVTVHLLAPGPVHTEFFQVARPGVTTRPPDSAFLSADRVARETLDALVRGRARHIPGLPVRLGFGVAEQLPMWLYRPVANLAARMVRARSTH